MVGAVPLELIGVFVAPTINVSARTAPALKTLTDESLPSKLGLALTFVSKLGTAIDFRPLRAGTESREAVNQEATSTRTAEFRFWFTHLVLATRSTLREARTPLPVVYGSVPHVKS